MSGAAKLSAKIGRELTCASCGEQVRVSWWTLVALVPPIAALVLFMFLPYAWALGGFLAATAVYALLQLYVVPVVKNDA
jgi:membrane protein YdbS with pleckstrin-like domain